MKRKRKGDPRRRMMIMGIYKKINNIEALAKDIHAILTVDKPYYEGQLEQIDEIKAKNSDLKRENKELREIIKKFETTQEKPKNSKKKASNKKTDEPKK